MSGEEECDDKCSFTIIDEEVLARMLRERPTPEEIEADRRRGGVMALESLCGREEWHQK